MKYLSVFVLFCLCACAYSCKGKYGDFQKSESGLEYQIFANHAESAARPQVGDVLELEYSYEVENGRVLFDSKENGRGYLKKLEEATQQGGCLEDGLAMMCEGDSAVFRIMAENFLLFTEKYGRLPEGVNGTDNIIVQVRLLNIMDKEDMEKFVASTYHNNEEQEMEFLSNYLKNSNISVEPTNSGLYYVPQTEGKGDFIKSGDIVTLNYT
ncbi:MAG: hypothetical protein HUK15_00890, partial [Bacteroidales bacterium]|nr:hypothetical protein [Bacteroidales bacterium]